MSDVVALFLNNPDITQVSNSILKVAIGYTVAFHEIAEAFAKVDGGKGESYEQGGAGGPADSQDPQEGGL